MFDWEVAIFDSAVLIAVSYSLAEPYVQSHSTLNTWPVATVKVWSTLAGDSSEATVTLNVLLEAEFTLKIVP